MRILFVLPGIGKKPGERYLKSWLMEPLTIAVLAGLTPPGHSLAFVDDRLETIDYDQECDLVAITLETYTAKRAYAMADRFRDRGKLVVFGGYHATLCPDDAAEHGDIVVTGNAETVWARVLDDIAANRPASRYHGDATLDYGLPDRSIYADKLSRYLPISLVEVGRGCRRRCEFCAISSYYHGRYRHRPIADIIADIKACPHKLFFLVDDSILSDRRFAEELFGEIARLKITWTTQITLDVAADLELLRLMKRSGCRLILIGFESVDEHNLTQMKKSWSTRLGERDALVERIHRVGISVYASFVFGFDADSRDSFEEVLAFSARHRFFVVAFNHLLAFPGTPTYQRIAADGRLFSPKWWLEDGYRYGTISFCPDRVSPEELSALCREYKRRFYTFGSILRRAPALLARTRSPMMHLAYWYINSLFHHEVDTRLGIPVGANLDEAAK